MVEKDLSGKALCIGEQTSWSPLLAAAGVIVMVAVGIFIFLANRHRPLL